MPFYKDLTNKPKTRQEKRAAAIARGGFEDEGATERRGGGRGKGKAQGEGRPQDARRAQGEGRPQGGRGKGKAQDSRRPQDENRPQGTRGKGKSRPQQEARPAGYRDNAVRQAPRGERPPMDNDAPRFDRRRSGGYRFATGSAGRYTERGTGSAPRPYGEQRKAREVGEPRRYEQFHYDMPEAPLPVADEAPVENENLLSGRNPIREALKSGRDIEKLMVARGELSGSAREIVKMAHERHIPVQEVDRARLDAITRNHQGMLAFASAYRYSTVEDMLALAEERGEAPFLVLLDGITDPHNLGAIIRTAECAGAHGVIVQERRAVGLTPAAVKASAGAVEYLPVARVPTLTNTIHTLKERNIWVYAADMRGEDYAKVDMSGAVALVIGAEGEGVSRRVLESCDRTLSLPIRGKLDSLNASVAAGVLMYAAMRAR